MKTYASRLSWHLFVILASFLVGLLSPGFAADESPCKPPAGERTKAISDILEAFECGGGTSEASPEAAEKRLRKLADSNPDKSQKAISFITRFSSRTSTSVTYNLSDHGNGNGRYGIELKPGQAIYLDVPADLSNRSVQFITLGHRQDPEAKQKEGWTQGAWDNHPTYTSVRVHNMKAESETDAWRYWGGPSSGPFGAKFPEIRSVPEIEGLYEWRSHGHAGVQSQVISTSPLYGDAIEIVAENKESDPVHDSVIVSQIILKVLPQKPDEYLGSTKSADGTVVFSPGTQIGDLETESDRRYGGGQQHEGRFPGALALGAKGASITPKLPEGWEARKGELIVPVPAGKRVTSVEVAGGDTHPDGIRNSDGGMGTQGWAKLDIGIEDGRTGQIDWFDQNENVPPEGVMIGSPTNCARATRPGDKIHIRGRNDTLYVMGVRIGVKNVR